MERFLFSSATFLNLNQITMGILIQVQSLNAVKLVLPIIFAMLLATNAVACLGLAAALLGCTFIFSVMYRSIYGTPPGTSIFLWCASLLLKLKFGLNTLTRYQIYMMTNCDSHAGMFATPLSLSASACPLLEPFL
jgi:hypothetical protein